MSEDNIQETASAEQRRKRNEDFTTMVFARWFDAGPASGRMLFKAVLSEAVRGPIDTPERARVLLPTLLEVLDEMEARQA